MRKIENTALALDSPLARGYQIGMSTILKEARLKSGLSQEALAQAAGTSQPQIKRLENAERQLTKSWAERLAPHVGMTAEGLMFAEKATALLPPDVIQKPARPDPQFLGLRDLPVFAAVEGGPGEMVISTDPIDLVPRPWFFAHVAEAYAVVVTGESMDPVYEPGDMVLVNPRLPCIKGKDAIFVAGEEDGEFRATIKRYMGATTEHWLARQFNPPQGQKADLKYLRKDWTRALRVVGKFTG